MSTKYLLRAISKFTKSLLFSETAHYGHEKIVVIISSGRGDLVQIGGPTMIRVQHRLSCTERMAAKYAHFRKHRKIFRCRVPGSRRERVSNVTAKSKMVLVTQSRCYSHVL